MHCFPRHLGHSEHSDGTHGNMVCKTTELHGILSLKAEQVPISCCTLPDPGSPSLLGNPRVNPPRGTAKLTTVRSRYLVLPSLCFPSHARGDAQTPSPSDQPPPIILARPHSNLHEDAVRLAATVQTSSTETRTWRQIQCHVASAPWQTTFGQR